MISLQVHGLDISGRKSGQFWSSYDVQKVIFVAAVDAKVKVTTNISFGRKEISDGDKYQFLLFSNSSITFSINPMFLPVVTQLATLDEAFPDGVEGVRQVFIDFESYGQLKLSIEYLPVRSVIHRMDEKGYNHPTFSELIELSPGNSGCPLVLEQCMEVIERYGLNTPHLYERCTSTQHKHKALAACLKNSSKQNLKSVVVQCSVHAFTGLVMDFFRDLPEPFLTNDISSALTQSASMDGKIDVLESFLLCLPDEVSMILGILLTHFHRLIVHRERNGVTAKSIAKLFGPLLLTPSLAADLDTSTTVLEHAEDYESQAKVLELLLLKACEL